MSAVWQIDFALGDDAMEATPTWTDVTSYVRGAQGINLKRGRRGSLGRVANGTGSFLLDNRDGRFTPNLSSGAYYPDIRVHVPVRVRATVNATTYDVFRGWATAWAPGLPGQVDSWSIVSFQMVDLFGVLDKRVIRSRIIETAKANGTYVHWPLWETGDQHEVDIFTPDGAALAPYYTLHTEQQLWGGSLIPGAVTGPDGETAHVYFDPKAANSGLALRSDLTGLTLLDAYDWTVYFWVSASGEPWVDDDTEAKSFPCELLYVSNGSQFIRVTLSAYVDANDTGGSLYVMLNTSSTPRLEGPYLSRHVGATRMATEATGWSSVVIRATGDITNQDIDVFVNGELVDSYSGSTIMSMKPVTTRIGGSPGGYFFVGAMAHVGIALTDWTDAQVAEFHASGYQGHRGERSGERLDRLASWQSLPNGTNFETGESLMGPAKVAGKSLTALLQEVAETEAGVVWAGPDGKLRFQDRASRRVAPAADYTLDWRYVQSGIPMLDHQELTDLGNVVIATHDDTGAQFVALDTASVAAYGEFSTSVTVNTDSYHEARARAQWQSSRAGDEPRWGDITVDLLNVPDAVAQGILGLDIGSRLTLDNVPTTLSGADPDLWVEGVSHKVTKTSWLVTLNTSPVRDVSVWPVGDTTAGKLTATTPVLAY